MTKKAVIFAILAVICGLFLFSSAFAEEGFKLPEGLQVIGEDAFAGTAIEEVTLPASVVQVEQGAFADTLELKAIHFEKPENLFGYADPVILRGPVTIERPEKIPNPSGRTIDLSEPALPPQGSGNDNRKQRTAEEDENNPEDGKTRQSDFIPNRARQTGEGTTQKPQERAEIHPVECDFP